MKTNRREFIKTISLGAAAVAVGPTVLSLAEGKTKPKSKVISTDAMHYDRIIGANDRVMVGIIGFSDRFRSTLSSAFHANAKALNMEFAALSDIWNERRESGVDYINKLQGSSITGYRNNEELK